LNVNRQRAAWGLQRLPLRPFQKNRHPFTATLPPAPSTSPSSRRGISRSSAWRG
jgi:hypothetical protein